MDEMTPDENAFISQRRWELASSHLDRADQSANMLRSLLFTASSAAVAFVLQQKALNIQPLHLGSIMLFLGSAACVLWSWDLQKRKSIARFNALARNDLVADNADKTARLNQTLDRFSAILFAVGVLFEILIGWFR